MVFENLQVIDNSYQSSKSGDLKPQAENVFPEDGFDGEGPSEKGFQASSDVHGLPVGTGATAPMGAGYLRRIDAWHGGRQMGLAIERFGSFGRGKQQ